MDSLNVFSVFVQVAETRSFVATGRVLGVSASAVGKRMARLEQRLGVRLLHRSTRSIALTAEGALFLTRSRRVIAEIEAAELEMSHATGAPRGRLRLSLPMAGTLLLPVFAGFMRAYPEIMLDLDFSDRFVDLIAEGFDAVVRGGEIADSRLSARTLGTVAQRLVASPDYLEQYGTPARPSDLVDHVCMHYRIPNSGKLDPWPLRVEEDESALALPQSLISNNSDTHLCFALRGLGIALLPDFAVRDALAAGALRLVLPAHTVPDEITFRLLWPAGGHPSPKLRALVDYLAAHLFAQPTGASAI